MKTKIYKIESDRQVSIDFVHTHLKSISSEESSSELYCAILHDEPNYLIFECTDEVYFLLLRKTQSVKELTLTLL
jgi:hypothetical protein